MAGRLRLSEDEVEGGGAHGGHAQPDGLASRDLEVEIEVDLRRWCYRPRGDIQEPVAPLVGLGRVRLASDWPDDHTDVLDRLACLVDDVPLEAPKPWRQSPGSGVAVG